MLSPYRFCVLLGFFYLLILFQPSSAQSHRIFVDPNQVMNRIPPTIYGSCIEDVNHEICGGLYGQLIFSESFEEPSSGINHRDWRKFTGYWAAEREYSSGGISIVPGRATRRTIGKVEVSVEPDDYARLIYEPLTMRDGTILFDIRFPEPKGQTAGILLRVSRAGVGEKAIRGYGISISRDGKKLFLTKHDNDDRLLQQASISVEAAKWNQVRVDLKGSLIRIFVNQQSYPAIEYQDSSSPFLSGKLGLSTTKTPAAFRNLLFVNGSDTAQLPLQNPANRQVSDYWDAIATAGAVTKFSLVQENVFHGLSAQTVELLQGKGKAGIANRGLNRWGIAIQAGQEFNGSAYLRYEDRPVQVTVALENVDGTATYARHTIALTDSDWRKYNFSLTSKGTDSNARFALYIEDRGKISVDKVSLFPTGDKLFKQLPMRVDIANAIINEKIAFMRYGGSMVNAEGYRVKKMIGPKDLRPPYTGHWNRFSTNGFGIEEFLQFCEAGGIEAAFAINIEESPEDAADRILVSARQNTLSSRTAFQVSGRQRRPI